MLLFIQYTLVSVILLSDIMFVVVMYQAVSEQYYFFILMNVFVLSWNPIHSCNFFSLQSG